MNPIPAGTELLETATKLAWLYGLGIVLAIVITIAFIGLVAWTMWTNNKREMRLAGIIDDTLKLQSNIIQAHDQREIAASASQAEANKFQRDEHKEMIDVLRAINQRSVESRDRGGHYRV